MSDEDIIYFYDTSTVTVAELALLCNLSIEYIKTLLLKGV